MNVTIGISFYNAEDYLSDAIKSILVQTYSHWELILIDDGSKDNSLKIADTYAAKDKRIRVISDGMNKKLPYRLNQITSEAKGDYIARMDADDVIAVDRIEKQVNFLEKNNQKNTHLVYSVKPRHRAHHHLFPFVVTHLCTRQK